MSKMEIVKDNPSYERMLAQITKNDINDYAVMYLPTIVFGSKLEMIEQIRNRGGDENGE